MSGQMEIIREMNRRQRQRDIADAFRDIKKSVADIYSISDNNEQKISIIQDTVHDVGKVLYDINLHLANAEDYLMIIAEELSEILVELKKR